MRSWTRWGLVGMALFLATCGGNSAQSGTHEPEGSGVSVASAWDRVVAGIDDGQVPLDTAVKAFSLAIGDLPDVEMPEGETAPIASGSGAIRWVLGHWDELDPEQQNAVTAYLTPSEPEGAGNTPILAMIGMPVAAEPDEIAILGLISQAEAEIAGRLGRELGVPIELHLGPNLVLGDAWAFAVATDATGGFFGHIAKCTISITKSGMPFAEQIEDGVASPELMSLIAHETFHCFEAANGKTLSEHLTRPPWVVEGLAEWVGETISGGSQQAHWPGWLQMPEVSLFNREYSALGFFAHLHQQGAQMWDAIDDVIVASNGGNKPAYETALAAAGPMAVASWGPSYYRDPTNAPDWDQDGPGIIPFKPSPVGDFPQIGVGADAVLAVAAVTGQIWDTDLQAEVVTIEGSGSGMVMLPDEAMLTLPDSLGTNLCTIDGGCTCPDGSPGAAAIFRLTTTGPTRIGLSGDLAGAALSIRGWSLESFCNDKPPIDQCLVGEWGSVSYSARDQEVIDGTGIGVDLTIDKEGQGFIDFSDSVPILVQIPSPDIPIVRIVQDGQARFEIDVGDGAATISRAFAIGYELHAQVDMGSGFVDAGEGVSFSGPGVGPGVTLTCKGDTLTWTAAGDVSEYVFDRNSSTADDLPPPPEDASEMDGADGGGGSDGGVPSQPPPDWGLNLDACAVLDIDQVRMLNSSADQPAGEQDSSSQFLHICWYPDAFFVEVGPPQPAALIQATADGLDLDLYPLDGIGDWAVVLVNRPDATFSIPDTVFMVAAGNSKGTVTLLLDTEVKQGTAEFDVLLGLLAEALGHI